MIKFPDCCVCLITYIHAAPNNAIPIMVEGEINKVKQNKTTVNTM